MYCEEGLPVEESLCCTGLHACKHTHSRSLPLWRSTRCLQSSSPCPDIPATPHVGAQQGRQPWGIPHAHTYSPYQHMQSCICGCLHMQIPAPWHTRALVAQVLLNVHARTGPIWAGQGSLLPLSLLFIEWEKAVSNFLLSAAGRHFSAVSCNLFQLCVLITACSWWDSS